MFSSVAGADTNRVVPHHRVETHLREHAPSWTILRPGFFCQNRIVVPAGKGLVAFIDTDDIGAEAGLVFSDPLPHRGRGYTLAGPEAVSFEEVAATLTGRLGRPIRYAPASILGYARHLRRKS